MKKITLIFLILIVKVVNAEDINGAFGFILGDDIKNYKKNIITVDNEYNSNLYEIDFKGFEFAQVSYTPITKKIHSVSTYKEVDDCYQEPKIIAGILEKKFGENLIKKDSEIKQTYYMRSNQNGRKGVLLQCYYKFENSKYMTSIIFTDLDEVYNAEKELINLSIEKEIDKL